MAPPHPACQAQARPHGLHLLHFPPFQVGFIQIVFSFPPMPDAHLYPLPSPFFVASFSRTRCALPPSPPSSSRFCRPGPEWMDASVRAFCGPAIGSPVLVIGCKATKPFHWSRACMGVPPILDVLCPGHPWPSHDASHADRLPPVLFLPCVPVNTQQGG